MINHIIPIKRALISVSDKSGIIELAKQLVDLKVELISTGGTAQLLAEAHIPYLSVEDLTGMPNLLDGRVKTLHPYLHAGILARRDVHESEVKQLNIGYIDLVIVNFYPFAEAKKQGANKEAMVEYIDIGGPTLVRAAAKNFAWVGVLTDPEDYASLIMQLTQQGGLDLALRQQLAKSAFQHTMEYDAMIYQYFCEETSEVATEVIFPQTFSLSLEKKSTLRYGENPHQAACAYQITAPDYFTGLSMLSAHQHQGKPLSYNNIIDLEAAWACVNDFSTPTCAIIKHATPCGVATAATIDAAYQLAYMSDRLSAFGGVVALNQVCTEAIAKELVNIFIEAIIAPGYTEAALALLSTKLQLRILQNKPQQTDFEMRFITGGLLIQEKDRTDIRKSDLTVVTAAIPSDKDITNLLFAWRVVKHIKSNAILIAKDQQTLGVGAGQVSRVEAVELALKKAGSRLDGAVLASDAFFPFRDSIDHLAERKIRAIIQPGGSIRDSEVIAACNEHDIAMVLTGKRCFKH